LLAQEMPRRASHHRRNRHDRGGLTPKKEFLMKALTSKVRRFLASEDGPTAVEYAVMLALILVVCIGIIASLGTTVSSTFSVINTKA
jgi:pilus assembly protein Flp/PilA